MKPAACPALVVNIDCASPKLTRSDSTYKSGNSVQTSGATSAAQAKIEEIFGKKPKFADVPGLCRAATLKEIEAQGWSLNPGRYVGVAAGEAVSDEDFKEQLETMNEELEVLNAQARDLEKTIARNVAEILET